MPVLAALGIGLARGGALVTIVEANPFALSDARKSASLSHVGRCRFRGETAEKFLEIVEPGQYDIVIVDPPRVGLSQVVIQGLERLRVSRVFYLSCDAATLARDLARLCAYGYRITRMQPFDMFPQTAHIETLVELAA